MEKGADPKNVYKDETPIQDEEGNTHLHSAIKNKNIEIVKLLLEKGAADLKDSEFTLLLDDKGNTPLQDDEGNTLIHTAVKEEVTEIVKELFLKTKYKKFIDIRDKKGKTPLHTAVKDEKIDIVRLLLDNGANPNAVSKEGETPLLIAAQFDNIDIVNLLLEKGADPKNVDEDEKPIQDKEGYTHLHHAVENGNTDLVTLLLEKGVVGSINIQDNKDNTPLDTAIEKEQINIPIVKLLLMHGAVANKYTEESIKSFIE